MTADTKKAMFYTVAELQGSTDQGRWINTWSHSTYGEWMDDVVNLDVFVNALKVALYNVLAKSTTKVPQTPVGQALLIGAARHVCETYIANGYRITSYNVCYTKLLRGRRNKLVRSI